MIDPEIEVLILVLVEHTLGEVKEDKKAFFFGLNPCFSGTYSRSGDMEIAYIAKQGLNPCFSGTYSRRRGRL